jgi:16S rRNA (cytosine967-C5)-methyltransferase
MKISASRAAAFDILLRVETTDAYASELLHSSRVAALSPPDHGLATEIVMGVLRWRSVLDEQVGVHASQPLAKFDAEVITALRIGAYQLLFLDRIPAHAAINESVELVKKARKRSATGMVNAVLRTINGQTSAAKAAEKGAPVSARLEDGPSREERENVRRTDDVRSHPAWLVKKWEQLFGTDAAVKICEYDQQAPKTAIRTDAARVDELTKEGIRLEPSRLISSAHIVASGDITRTKAFRERRLVIQDEGSQLIALMLGHGKRILDCCAAPGGKARIIAEQNPDATVLAMELHPHRAALLKRLVPLPNVRIIVADARTMSFAASFDRVLVDAPCTGTGTLARNPEIKWRLRLDDITRLQVYQIEILSAAMKHVAPGGRILYSSCSLEPEENEDVIGKVLQTNTAFRVLDVREHLEILRREGILAWQDVESLVRGPYLRTIPGVHPCDGFFGALLERAL